MNNNISRRTLVKSAVVLGNPLIPGFKFLNAEEDQDFLTEFGAWADTLIPSDAESRGAGEMGVHLEVVKKVEANPDFMKLLRAGVDWANRQAIILGELSFAKLDSLERIRVVTFAEGVEPPELPGVFFHHTRKEIMSLYYAHEESWAGVGFPHSPQPLGFLDHAVPPKIEAL